ncbi:MAG: helix-turn-helix domain-containing protein [Clostridia bacterium]|nr:helix-turn-helix domain-containing protein [Clostridia bacterium]
MRYQYWRDHFDEGQLPIVFKIDEWPPREIYYSHWHKSVEILLITEGMVEIFNNDRSFCGRPGEMYVIHSTHEHSFRIGDQPTSYFCLMLSENLFPNKNFFVTPLPFMTTDKHCIELYEKAWEVYQSQPKFYEETVLGLLLQLYAALANVGAEQPFIDNHSINLTVRDAIRYIQHHYPEKLCIEDIATAVGVSRHHLCHIFKEVTGTTPALYWKSVRCDEARQMLRKGASVAETAEACGFSSAPYFAKVYYKHFAILPSDDKAK